MNFLAGSPKNSWQPVMTADTTTSSYWLNWMVLLCAVWVFLSMVFASILIFKYEVSRNSRQGSREDQKEPAGVLYDDEVWKRSLKGIHPAWLLAFCLVAFFVILVLMILNVSVDGGIIFYFYTQ
uniref:Transmembrane protein n=1 Tax=Davidia involucrata TaxID=16924 RepID=A0A5B7AIX8_DAVIN